MEGEGYSNSLLRSTNRTVRVKRTENSNVEGKTREGRTKREERTREIREKTGASSRCTTPRTTEIRRNFNIPWRAGNRAGCNPLDKRLPAPWCLLTNRGHRSRAARLSNETSGRGRKDAEYFAFRRGGTEICWIESKQFRRALSPKQIARSSSWWFRLALAIIASVVLDDSANVVEKYAEPSSSWWVLRMY